MNISAAQWLRILCYCGVRFTTAVDWAKVFEAHVQPERFSLQTGELDDFVGQVLHETQLLERLEENLNYSAKRLTEVWPTRFPTLADAGACQYNPEGLANRVYGGRLGNTEPDDGWKFRGRGALMVTGRANYATLQGLTGLPLLEQPDLLAQPITAMRCAVAWWEQNVPDRSMDSIERVTRAVNGGQIGLDDRKALTAKVGQALVACIDPE